MEINRQQMRCTHIVPSIANEASGPSYAVIRLCEELIKNGHDITLAALDWAPLYREPAFLKTFALGFGPRRLGNSPSMNSWLRADSKKENSRDYLIHNHGMWMMPNVYPGQIARCTGVPLITSPHNTLSAYSFKSGSKIKRLFWPLLQKKTIDMTACFHATAKSEFHDIRRMGYKQPVAIIPLGIDIPPIIKTNTKNDRILLYLGRIHPEKGIDILLTAWKHVQELFPEWKLKIVGPDNRGYLSSLKNLAAYLHLERIEFVGPLYGKDKIAAYQNADIFVLPSHSENFGVVVAEALAAGTPAIVSKGAPWEELHVHNAGWWIDIGIDPLVACLEETLGLPSTHLANMGACGRAWMVKEFSWSRIGNMMTDTYKWVLHGGIKPAWIK